MKSAGLQSEAPKPLDLLEADLQQLGEKNIVEFSKDQMIYQPGDKSEALYFVVQGKIRIAQHSKGAKELTKAFFVAGDMFGELALILGHSRRDFAIAVEDTSLLLVPGEQLLTLIHTNTDFNLKLMKFMGSKLLTLEERLENIVFKDSKTRILEYLRKLIEEKGVRIGYEILIRNFPTHQQIANHSATSRQTVTTVLNNLRNKNIVTFDRKRILIREPDQI